MAHFSKFCCLCRDTDESKQSKITVLNNFIIQPHSIEVHFTACSSIQLIQREQYIQTLPLTSTCNGNFISRAWIGIDGNSRKLNLSLSVKTLVLLVLLHQSIWLTLSRRKPSCAATLLKCQTMVLSWGMVYSTPATLHHLSLLHSLGIFLKQEDLDKPGL